MLKRFMIVWVAAALIASTALGDDDEVRFALPSPVTQPTSTVPVRDVDALLAAIRMREGAPQGQTGRDGGRGHYQFMPATWRQHTSAPLAHAKRRDVADQVARAHVRWICDRLEANGLRPTPFRIAMAWNAGVGAVIRDTAPSRARLYAEHVQNLYHDLLLTSG